MSTENHVGPRRPTLFGQYRIASAFANIAATGNAVANLSILGGGITVTGGAYTVRRVLFSDLNLGNINAGNVQIISSNDGNQGNAITGNTLLSSLTGNLTFQEAALNATANSTLQSAQCLFLSVNTANASGTSLLVSVYGDIVVP